MSSEHRQSSYEKYGCPACVNGNAGDRHDPECTKFQKPKTETEIIREAVNKAAEHVSPLLTHAIRELRNDDARRLRELTDALYAIRDANERRDKDRQLSVQVSMPDMSEYTCRALLEIGFDMGVAALRAKANEQSCCSGSCFGACGFGDPVNPFRRESTTTADKYPERATKCTCPNDPPGLARVAPDCPAHNRPPKEPT